MVGICLCPLFGPVLGWNLPFTCLQSVNSDNSTFYCLSHRCFIPICLFLQGPIDLNVSSGATHTHTQVWRRWFKSSFHISLISFRKQVPLWHVQELKTSWVNAMAGNLWDKKKRWKSVRSVWREKCFFKLSQGIMKSISVNGEVGPWCGSVLGRNVSVS